MTIPKDNRSISSVSCESITLVNLHSYEVSRRYTHLTQKSKQGDHANRI